MEELNDIFFLCPYLVIQQKVDDLKKVQELEEGIHKILGESQSCEAEKLKLQDQLDR